MQPVSKNIQDTSSQTLSVWFCIHLAVFLLERKVWGIFKTYTIHLCGIPTSIYKSTKCGFNTPYMDPMGTTKGVPGLNILKCVCFLLLCRRLGGFCVFHWTFNVVLLICSLTSCVEIGKLARHKNRSSVFQNSWNHNSLWHCKQNWAHMDKSWQIHH